MRHLPSAPTPRRSTATSRLRSFLGGAAGVLSLLVSGHVARANPPPRHADLAGVPPMRWTRLSDPADDAQVPAGLLAYSGMCVDPKGSRVLLFGGGHADYHGNEVWAWDLAARHWSRLTEPTPRERYPRTRWDWDATPGMFPDLRVPVARHTYDAVEWVEHRGEMYAGGSSTWSGRDRHERMWDEHYVRGATGPWKDKGWGPFDTWLFDPAAARWTYLRPPAAIWDGGNFCAYSPDHRVVVVMRSGAAGVIGPTLFDPDRRTWTPRKPFNPGGGIHQTMTYDGKRRRCYVVGGTQATDVVHAYDVDNDAWSRVEVSGPAPRLGSGTGAAYAARDDVLVTFGTDGTWVLDLATREWRHREAAEGRDAASPPRGEVFGRLQYDAGSGLTLLVKSDADRRVSVWGYRERAPGGDRR